jgi:ribonuclease D
MNARMNDGTSATPVNTYVVNDNALVSLPGEVSFPTLVDAPNELAEMLDSLAGEPALAIDTESDSLYRYYYRVCLIQISSPTTDFVLDPLRLGDLRPLGVVMANPRVQKVFHAAENDILVLKRDFDFSFSNIFDTMVAARILGNRRVGLAALLQEHFGVVLDKKTQLTDWGRRPLTPQQLNYAHLDTHYLLGLRDVLTADLERKHRWREAQDAFDELPDISFVEKGFDPNGFWRNKGVRDLSPVAQAILRELFLWRDSKARALDLPAFKVIDDHSLLQIAERAPRSISELWISKWQEHHLGADIVAAVERGLTSPAPVPPARVHNDTFRPDGQTMIRFDRLRAWRVGRAEQRGVDNDVVLTNDVLLAVARANPTTLSELSALGLMGEYKLEEYGPTLLAAMKGQQD